MCGNLGSPFSNTTSLTQIAKIHDLLGCLLNCTKKGSKECGLVTSCHVLNAWMFASVGKKYITHVPFIWLVWHGKLNH